MNCSIILWINYYYFSFFFGLYAILITKYFHRYYLGELKYSQVFLFYLYGTKKLIGVQVLLNYREKCIGRSHVFNGCPSFSWLYFSLIFLVSLFNCKYLQYYSLFYLLFLYEPEYKNSNRFIYYFYNNYNGPNIKHPSPKTKNKKIKKLFSAKQLQVTSATSSGIF